MVYYAKQISIGEAHQKFIESQSLNLSRFVRRKLDEEMLRIGCYINNFPVQESNVSDPDFEKQQ